MKHFKAQPQPVRVGQALLYSPQRKMNCCLGFLFLNINFDSSQHPLCYPILHCMLCPPRQPHMTPSLQRLVVCILAKLPHHDAPKDSESGAYFAVTDPRFHKVAASSGGSDTIGHAAKFSRPDYTMDTSITKSLPTAAHPRENANAFRKRAGIYKTSSGAWPLSPVA